MKANHVRASLAAACATALTGAVALAGPAAAAVPMPRIFGPNTLADICDIYAPDDDNANFHAPNIAAIAAFEAAYALTFVYGTPGADHIVTGSGDQMVIGYGGDDEIETGSGKDYVCGGSGNDEISLGSGHDEAVAGAGDDTVFGGSGNDLLTGGLGADLFGGDSGDDGLTDKAVPEICVSTNGTDVPAAC